MKDGVVKEAKGMCMPQVSVSGGEKQNRDDRMSAPGGESKKDAKKRFKKARKEGEGKSKGKVKMKSANVSGNVSGSVGGNMNFGLAYSKSTY